MAQSGQPQRRPTTGRAGNGRAGGLSTGRSGKGGSGKGPSFAKSSTPSSGARPPVAGSRQAAAKGRQSVAAARRTKAGSSRTQLVIGSVAVAVIAALVIVGVILYKKGSATQGDGYGPSTNSVSSVTSGVVTVDNGTKPPLVVDFYQDPLCGNCQLFEHQFAQQINQAVDEGKLTARYHSATFLDQYSASKNYSTRAAAALLCVGADTAAPKGTFLKYLAHLYADDTKPAEGGTTDLTNQQLADLAKGDGATPTAVSCIADGSNVGAAQAANTTAQAEMQAATGQVATPTVLRDGKPVNINSTGWLTDLLAGK